jgi:site-specific DNA-cytosine methylase
MINPTYERGYNVRELLWLMGMPHDFELLEFKKNWNHICQNVPVKTATFIGNNIKDYLNNNLKIDEIEFLKQSNFNEKVDFNSNDAKW